MFNLSYYEKINLSGKNEKKKYDWAEIILLLHGRIIYMRKRYYNYDLEEKIIQNRKSK